MIGLSSKYRLNHGILLLWKDADLGIAEVEGAKKRLAGLKSKSEMLPFSQLKALYSILVSIRRRMGF